MTCPETLQLANTLPEKKKREHEAEHLRPAYGLRGVYACSARATAGVRSNSIEKRRVLIFSSSGKKLPSVLLSNTSSSSLFFLSFLLSFIFPSALRLCLPSPVHKTPNTTHRTVTRFILFLLFSLWLFMKDKIEPLVSFWYLSLSFLSSLVSATTTATATTTSATAPPFFHPPSLSHLLLHSVRLSCSSSSQRRAPSLLRLPQIPHSVSGEESNKTRSPLREKEKRVKKFAHHDEEEEWRERERERAVEKVALLNQELSEGRVSTLSFSCHSLLRE